MTGTSIFPSLLAVIIIAKIRKFVQRFKVTGTTSPQTAKTLEELNLKRRFAFRRMLKREVIIESSPDRFYLHEVNLDRYNNTRRMIMLGVIIILAVIILADALFLHY